MAKETAWLRTAEGYVRVPVLRPFTFLYKIESEVAGMTRTTARERHFKVGEHLLNPNDKGDDAAFLAHSWINEHFADGYIESPEKTRARLEVELAQAKAIRERQESLQREAEVALQRANQAAESQGVAGNELASELDTPLNQPRKRSGPKAVPDIDPQVLDTPLNKLAKG